MDCTGNTYNISMGCCRPVLGPIENYYTKWETERYVSGYTYSKEEIDEKTSGETSGCCITPEEVDEKIASAITDVEAEIPSLSAYSTTEEVNNAINQATSGSVDSGEVQTIIDESISGKVDSTAFETFSGEVTTSLGEKALQSDLDTLNGVVTAHTADTTVHITSAERTTWNNKANVWCGDSTAWAAISGGTLDNNTIYLVYNI